MSDARKYMTIDECVRAHDRECLEPKWQLVPYRRLQNGAKHKFSRNFLFFSKKVRFSLFSLFFLLFPTFSTFFHFFQPSPFLRSRPTLSPTLVLGSRKSQTQCRKILRFRRNRRGSGRKPRSPGRTVATIF